MGRNDSHKNSTSQPSSFFAPVFRDRSQSTPVALPTATMVRSNSDVGTSSDVFSFISPSNDFVKSSSPLASFAPPKSLQKTNKNHDKPVKTYGSRDYLTFESFVEENKLYKDFRDLLTLKNTTITPFHDYALLTKTQMNKALIMESRQLLKDAFSLFESAINYVFSQLRITAEVMYDAERNSLIRYFSQTIGKEPSDWDFSQFSFDKLPSFLRENRIKEHFNAQINRAKDVYEKYKNALDNATYKSTSALFHDAIPEEIAQHYYRMDDLLASLFREVAYQPRDLFLEQQHFSKQLADKIKEGVGQWQEEESTSPPKTLHLSGSFTCSSPRGEGFFYLSRAWGDSLKKHLHEQWRNTKEPLGEEALNTAVKNWFSQLKDENPSPHRTPSQRRQRYLNGM